MNAKHTPGPWTICPTINERIGIIGDGVQIATVHPTDDITASYFPGLRSSEEIAANARLIAAAPELLEACRALLGCVDLQGFSRSQPDVVSARAAIAKATS